MPPYNTHGTKVVVIVDLSSIVLGSRFKKPIVQTTECRLDLSLPPSPTGMFV